MLAKINYRIITPATTVVVTTPSRFTSSVPVLLAAGWNAEVSDNMVPYTPNLAKKPANGGIPAKENKFRLNKIKGKAWALEGRDRFIVLALEVLFLATVKLGA